MNNKYFMIDIETMGTNFDRDDIIQIGILEVTKDPRGYYNPGRSYVQTLYTDQEPLNEWIRTNHADLLTICRKETFRSAPEVRAGILNFFRQCGVTELAQLMGLNAMGFDVPYLVNKKYLVKPEQGEDNILRGDYHYRVFELSGVYTIGMDILGLDRKDFFKVANDACGWIDLPKGKKHDALYDCYAQLKTLNGVIKLLKR